MEKRIGLKKVVYRRTSNGRIDNKKHRETELMVYFSRELLKKAVIEEKYFKDFGKGFKITLNGQSWKVRPSIKIEEIIEGVK